MMVIFIWNKRMERRMVLYPCKKRGILSSLPSPASKHFHLWLHTNTAFIHQNSSGEFLEGFPPPAPCPPGASPSPPSLLHMQIPSGSILTRPVFLHGRYPQRNFSYFISGAGMLGAAGWEGFPAADSWIPVFSAALVASRAKYRDSALS